MSPLLLCLSMLLPASAEEPTEGSAADALLAEQSSLIDDAEEAMTLPEPTAVVASAPGIPVVAQPRSETVISEELLAERLLSAPSVSSASPLVVGSSSRPWWMWPLGMLGAAGVAGLMFQNNRKRDDGIPCDVQVLSRTAVTRSSSLAVIEVSDAGGDIRRMLIGVGGGAPRLVADLTAGSSAAIQMGTEPLSEPVAAAAADLEAEWMREGEEPAPAAEPELDAPRRRGVSAYRAPEAEEPVPVPVSSRRQIAAKTELISEVLAEREEPAARPARRRRQAREEETWEDPWARNFASFLGQPGQSK
jgi:hypothetical protein